MGPPSTPSVLGHISSSHSRCQTERHSRGGGLPRDPGLAAQPATRQLGVLGFTANTGKDSTAKAPAAHAIHLLPAHRPGTPRSVVGRVPHVTYEDTPSLSWQHHCVQYRAAACKPQVFERRQFANCRWCACPAEPVYRPPRGPLLTLS